MYRSFCKIQPKYFHFHDYVKIDLSARQCSTSCVAVSRNKQINNIFLKNVNNNYFIGDSKSCYFNSTNIFKSQHRNFSDVNSYGKSIYNWLSESTPVAYTQDLIIYIHDTTNLPWWATIILTTCVLRSTVTIPLAIYQTLMVAKLENLTLIEMPEIAKEVKQQVDVLAVQNEWNDLRARLAFRRMLKTRWNALIIRDNCHPFKGIITIWFQLPMWIFITVALRNIAYMAPYDAIAQIQYLQMSVGGFLWIPNLTIPDGTWILPILLGITNLANIEMQALKRYRTPTRFQKIATNFFRFISVAMVPISASVPSAICLYWTTSSIFGLGQNLLLMSNRLRRVCRIPDTPSTVDNPYRQLMEDIKQRSRSFTTVFGTKRQLKKNN